MAIEAYEIGVNLVGNAARVVGPIGEMIEALQRLLVAQREAQQGFNSMASALGGARRLAGGMATDMERAARAARDIASASGRFRPVPMGAGVMGVPAGTGAGRSAPPVPPVVPVPTGGEVRAPVPVVPPPGTVSRGGSYVSPYSAAATNVPGAPQLLLPPPPVRTPSTALVPLPNQGDSMTNGPNFRASIRPNSYQPNWTLSQNAPSAGALPIPPPAPPIGPTRIPPGGRPRAQGGGHGAMGMLGHVIPGMAGFELAHGTVHAIGSGLNQAGVYDQTFLGMEGDPIAAANMPEIQESARQAMRDNQFLSPVDAARMAQEAYEVSGGHMGEQAPIASLINRVDRSFQLLGKSPEEAMRESIAFIRAQDISNRFYDPHTGQFSMERASRSTDSALGMLLANRQFMRGQNFQSFATSAGLAAQSMSDAGMLNLAHFIDVNPRRAGMQVRSFENLFAGDHSRMTAEDFSYFQRLGMTDRNGRFRDQDRLAADPIGWITQNLSPLIASHPELLGHIQRMNVSDLVGETTGAEGNIARQSAAARRTDAARSVTALEGGQQAQSLAMHTAWERLEYSVGRVYQGPFIKGLQALTQAFNGVSDFIQKHPDDMKVFSDQATALVNVISTIVGGVAKVFDMLPTPVRHTLEGGRFGVPGMIYAGAKEEWNAVRDHFHTPNRTDMAAGSTRNGPAALTDTHVGTAHISLNLNGREIASAMQDVQFRQAQQDMRASGTAPDVIQHPQLPGRAIGR